MYKMFSDTQSNALRDMVTETEAQGDERRTKKSYLICVWPKCLG